MRIVVYQTAEPLRPSEKFMAFLVTGNTAPLEGGGGVSSHSCLLPVRFCAETAQGARELALAFWDEEIAKERSRRSRALLLGERRRKRK